MSEQINGWLAQGGGVLAGGVAALAHGGLLGGLALLVIVLAIAVKMAGPELRAWRMMLWAREDSRKVEAIGRPPAGVDDDLPNAA